MNVVKSVAQRKSKVRFINMECVTEWLMALMSLLGLMIGSKTKIRKVEDWASECLGNGKYSNKV